MRKFLVRNTGKKLHQITLTIAGIWLTNFAINFFWEDPYQSIYKNTNNELEELDTSKELKQSKKIKNLH